ncbi:YceI family protein [Henriciella marina]|uniref:YceI family protein n=1 Tax=Henriciella marina TaxID=453851 RepID=UPI0003716E70|nr:YceI family protein [Henriciella marina]
MRGIVTIAALAALSAAPALAEQTLEGVDAATYELDPNHSFLTFSVTHNGISTYTVYFTDFDATLDFNPEDPAASTINATINPGAVESNYPGDYTGTVTGDLSFRGETRPVTLDVTYNGMANVPWMGERDLIGFTATTTINRSEFGMDALQGIISDDVTIEFSGEFTQTE